MAANKEVYVNESAVDPSVVAPGVVDVKVQ